MSLTLSASFLFFHVINRMFVSSHSLPDMAQSVCEVSIEVIYIQKQESGEGIFTFCSHGAVIPFFFSKQPATIV